MRKKYIFGKKLYISILTSILVLLTTVATTFAWVGVFANSTFEQYDFNIKSSALEDYGIEVSLTGEEGTFSNSIPARDIKKSILLNWGYSEENLNSVDIDDLFTTLNMDQCTTLPNISSSKITSFNTFTDIEGNETTHYFKFDVYVSAVKFYESGNSSDFKLEAFLNKGMLTGHVRNKILTNPFVYPDSFNNPLQGISLPNGVEPVLGSTRIASARVNSKSVCRVGFEKYEVVDKYHPEQYTSASLPKSAVIYSGDSYEYPTYDTEEKTYEFGSILPDELNVAIGYYNSTEWLYTLSGIKSVSTQDSTADIYAGDIYNIRGVGGICPDKVFNWNTNRLIDPTNVDEQIGVNQMMKITVSFWIEGWDADCFNAIGNSPITLTLSLVTKNDEEF